MMNGILQYANDGARFIRRNQREIRFWALTGCSVTIGKMTADYYFTSLERRGVVPSIEDPIAVVAQLLKGLGFGFYGMGLFFRGVFLLRDHPQVIQWLENGSSRIDAAARALWQAPARARAVTRSLWSRGWNALWPEQAAGPEEMLPDEEMDATIALLRGMLAQEVLAPTPALQIQRNRGLKRILHASRMYLIEYTPGHEDNDEPEGPDARESIAKRIS